MDLIETANAVIDIDADDPNKLICDLTLKEKSRLTATIGASHDVHSMSQLNGSLSVGVRNVFGRGERLDLSADLGLGTTNQSSLMNMASRRNSNGSNDHLAFSDDSNSANNAQQNETASIYNIVHNTSNQYSITLMKPRVDIFGNAEMSDYVFGDKKSSLILKAFQQKLDRTRSSSYRQDSLGFTSSLISFNKQHCLSYNYHLRLVCVNVHKLAKK